jgi:prepilin-type N-terminal cleavage/methylation domain-containing protein
MAWQCTAMKTRAPIYSWPRGFTLVEVIVALGITAIGVTAVVGLLAALTRMTAELKQRGQAVQLGDAIAVELRRLRDASTNDPERDPLDVLADRIPPSGSANPLRLVASGDGLRFVAEADLDQMGDGFPPRDRIFLVELRRKTGALTYAADAGFLAVTATVRWPYERLSAESVATPSAASFVVLNVGVAR